MITISLTPEELKMLVTLLAQAQVRGVAAMKAVIALLEKLSAAAPQG